MAFELGQPGSFTWRKAILAGLIAGVAFLVAEICLTYFVFGQEPWQPVQEKAAVVMAGAVEPARAGIDPVTFGAAVVVHMAISVLFALALAWLVHYWSASRAVAAGLAFGFALFLAASYGLSGWFPWLEGGRDEATLAGHLVFGAVTALTYKMLSRPSPFDESLSPARG